jgi:hypothetical protein
LKEKDLEMEELKQRISSLEDKVNDLYKIINKNKEQQQELHDGIIQEIIEEEE